MRNPPNDSWSEPGLACVAMASVHGSVTWRYRYTQTARAPLVSGAILADSAGSTTVFRNDVPTSGRRRIEAGVLLVDPALVVRGILDRQCLLGDVQWTERIHHHRQLVGALGADRRFGAS